MERVQIMPLSIFPRRMGIFLLLLSAAGFASAASPPSTDGGARYYNVKAFGAAGDEKTIDTAAVNKAIDAASSAGGGTVHFPAGTYRCYSIRLKSNVALYLDYGSTILAADPPASANEGYDPPEPNAWDAFQDFGHSHWQNSLIWGENLVNVSIIGPGLIDGRGLNRDDNKRQGQGNKAVSLKSCRNVILRDISMLRCGHFAVLATGVDNFTIDNLKIDTNRDGINIDCCRNVRVSNCTVNSPNDDAIVLKSSYGLGVVRATENTTITNCQVSGFDVGSLLDGTFKRTQQSAMDRDGPTGRIKLGTESNGGFKNITISNCVFDRCRGLAIECVDGGAIEDVTISNIAMRDVMQSPIFIRLGNRARGPNNPPVGAIRRVNINDVVASNADPRFGCIISGIPGHSIEDVRLSNVRIIYQGGGTKADAALDPPENEAAYPEPNMFGRMPAYGFYARHVNGLEMHHVEVSYVKDEMRPVMMLNDVNVVDFDNVKGRRTPEVPFFVLRNVTTMAVHNCPGLPDVRRAAVELEAF
jgi:polygalacturonase